jgi:hypothetical protein
MGPSFKNVLAARISIRTGKVDPDPEVRKIVEILKTFKPERDAVDSSTRNPSVKPHKAAIRDPLSNK